MAITVYKKTALTGGAAGSLDGIDGAGLLDGDYAIVTVANVDYRYILDDDSGVAESSPTVITPDANAGTKRWVIQKEYGVNGITASAAELNLVDGSVAGTAVASKALVLGANKNVDTLVVAQDGLKIGSGAGTAVTATAAELNTLDGITASVTELNYMDNVTSAVQTQLGALDTAKAPKASPVFTGRITGPVQTLTASGNITSDIVLLSHDTVTINAALPAGSAGKRCLIIDTSGSTQVHNVTLASGDHFQDGNSNWATFNAAFDILEVVCVGALGLSTNRWVTLINSGVTFSSH